MRKILLKNFVVLALYPSLCGFVLLGKDAATLPATVDLPTISLLWDGQAPVIQAKEKFSDGTYASASDAQIMEQILKKAAATWSNIPGSFIKFTVSTNSAAVEDSTDKKYSVVLKSLGSASEAGAALPIVIDGVIDDCDIALPPSSIDANDLLHTLIHEFGHCLGLGHAHTNYNAIMGYSGSSSQIMLGADDIAGAIYLYSDPNDPEAKKFRQLIGIGCGVVNGGASDISAISGSFSGSFSGSSSVAGLLLLILPLSVVFAAHSGLRLQALLVRRRRKP